MNIYWAYMLRCADDSFYVGVTNDLQYRVDQHNFGFDPRCYTFKRRPVELVYCAEFYHIVLVDAVLRQRPCRPSTGSG